MLDIVRKTGLTMLLALITLTAFAQTEIKVDAPNIVESDEQFNVTFIIEGSSRPGNFSWAPGDDFTLVWGPQSGSSSSVSIINGKRTSSSQFTYTYIIAPKKTGKFTLPQATAKVKGEMISSAPLQIEVLSGGSSSNQAASASHPSTSQRSSSSDVSSSDIFLRLSLSKTNVVVGEPINAELKLYQRVDVAGYESPKFPTFNGFWSKETYAPNNVNFQREDVDGRLYNAATLRRYVLVPQQTGTLVIDPAELVCLVNVRSSSSSARSIFDSFFDTGTTTIRKRIATSSVRVNVKNLPGGAPASFCGGVGNFTINAKLNQSQLKAHEANSLIITVSGRGNVSLLEAPKVNFPPDMEVYDTKSSENTTPNSGGTSGSKTFEYPFIPRSHGDFIIEPIEYSYYNVTTGKYETLTTAPIPFNVEKGDTPETTGSSMQVAVPDRKDVKNLGEDVRYIRTKDPSYKFRTVFFVGSAGYWFALVLILFCAVVIWLAFRKIASRRADVVGSRNRRATKMALSRLKTAEGFLSKNLYSAFYEELHKALLGFISDKLNMGAEELNKDNIKSQLVAGSVSAELADRFVALLDACEFARYSPDGGNEAMNIHYKEAVDVISSIDYVMKRRTSGGSAAKSAALAIASLLLLQTGLQAGEMAYLDSLWTKGANAYASGNWSESAEAWGTLEKAGVVSPELYYNLGNAYFKSGDNARAVLYYERTLKANPSFADARYNLDIVRSRIKDKIDVVPEFILKSWARKLCYTLSSNVWAVLSLLFFAVSLALALVFLMSHSAAGRRCGFYGAIVVFLLAVSSFSFALWQRSMFLKQSNAVIMTPVSSVKSSPSENASKDLFVLHEGTEVKVLDSVGDWNNVELSDGRQGWIRNNEMEII